MFVDFDDNKRKTFQKLHNNILEKAYVELLRKLLKYFWKLSRIIFMIFIKGKTMNLKTFLYDFFTK